MRTRFRLQAAIGPLLVLALAAIFASCQEVTNEHETSLAQDLQIQEWMRELRRAKRATSKNTQLAIAVLPGFDLKKLPRELWDREFGGSDPMKRRRRGRISRVKRRTFCPLLDPRSSLPPTVVLGSNHTGRCVLSADQASHFCGVEEVSSPPIPPPEAGKCITSNGGREICYPAYEDLDTSCTDVGGGSSVGLVAPPKVEHATVRAMAFVPPDNLRRLIIQYYRQHGKALPKNTTFPGKSFLFVKYHCETGYDMRDEIDTMFCQNSEWVKTRPECVGRGKCAGDNGGCSHTCVSYDDKAECRCPRGLTLDVDGKTCIKPMPQELCRRVKGCSCNSIDDVQYSCTCPMGVKCLLKRGPPKIYLNPPGPFEVAPGGNVNITCATVGYPFPEIYWQREDEEENRIPVPAGNAKAEQILMLKELNKNTKFTCYASNEMGSANRTVHIIITGPGQSPILRGVKSGRTDISVRWDPPSILNRPITTYTVYYTPIPNAPMDKWKKVEISEPTREATIPGLKPNTNYRVRLRAHDAMGPGKLGSPVNVQTLAAAKPPRVIIRQGGELKVAPLKPFELECKVTSADPIPLVSWRHKNHIMQTGGHITSVRLKHGGLLETTNLTCHAENEAGTGKADIRILITGPGAPERIRYSVEGDKVHLQWEPPKVTNGPLVGYDVLYTDMPILPEEEWQVFPVNTGHAKGVTVPNLKEKQNYTFAIRGRNRHGPGLLGPKFAAKTWLGAKAPTVELTPSEKQELPPTQDELSVECTANGVPKPKIIWLWNGQLVEDGKDEFRHYDTTPAEVKDYASSKLIAQSTTRTGHLTCQAINEVGSNQQVLDVTVLGPGSPPQNIHTSPMHQGFNVSWLPPKQPNGVIKNYIIYYTKDPEQDIGDWETMSVGESARNATVSVDEEDTPYTVKLQAVSNDGPGIISNAYDVTTGRKQVPLSVKIVITKPEFEEGQDEAEVAPAQPIHFRCVAAGRPMPSVTYSWLPVNPSEGSGDEPVPMPVNPEEDNPHHYESIEVYSTTSSPRKLLCQARNQDGTVEDSKTFIVKQPGSPPKDVEAVVDTDNRVTLSWAPPKYPNGDVKGYTVYLTGDPSKPVEEWQVFKIEDPSKPSIVFLRGELEPDTPYYIRVSASNDAGEGVLSDPHHFNTVSGAPLDAPQEVTTDVALDNTITIAWAPPQEPNGPIKEYTVYFAPDDGTADSEYTDWPRIQVPAISTNGANVTIPQEQYQILPNTPYKIRISATNDLSEGPVTEEIVFETGSGETAPVITVDHESPIMVDPLGAVSVVCTATGVPTPTVKWIIDDQETIEGGVLQKTGLLRDIHALCEAENNAGKSAKPVQIQVKGPSTPPNEITVRPLPKQDIIVEWTNPDEPNGQITGYIVHYGEVPEGSNEPAEWKTIEAGPDGVSQKLESLEPKKNYAIRIQAVSDRGPGVLSPTQTVKTLPLAPAKIDDVKVTVHKNNSVFLEFAPPADPEDPGKHIGDFVVEYTEDDPPTDETEWKVFTYHDPEPEDSEVVVKIEEALEPETTYNVRVAARGEVDGEPCDPLVFTTGDGIIPPSTPVLNVDAEDDTINVPAGTDYSIECSSDGHPDPEIQWLDENGELLSDGNKLTLQDIRRTVEAKCVAKNAGGESEAPFTIHVAGPGSAPEDVHLTADRPKTITAMFDPPEIRNGNITKYIVYYKPLADQNPNNQIGQVVEEPVSSWPNMHHDQGDLNNGPQTVNVKQFIEPDTAYAIVVQAVNDEGSGPYSNQYTIRSMSKARMEPPVDLVVNPNGQKSASIQWKMNPPPDDQRPVGYEIFYVPGDKSVDADEQASSDWFKISIDDPDKLAHAINNLLNPDTDYVFKIRAVYEDGPSVFSQPCIMKTLPDGTAPYITVSNGDNGVEGLTEIDVLPGSTITVACNATGHPQPKVEWIRAGSASIDPSTVHADEVATAFSLHVANLSEDTTFNCLAQNSLGKANWTISLNMLPGLKPNWQEDFVVAKIHDGIPVLKFTDFLPSYLKTPNEWRIYYSEDPGKRRDEWHQIDAEGRPLSIVQAPDMTSGTFYYVVVANPERGIESPTILVQTPKPPHDLRVGTNINDEIVIDFKPAISYQPIKSYSIRYWPIGNASAVPHKITVGPEETSAVLYPVQRDSDYYVSVAAEYFEDDELPSDPVQIHTPPGEIKCNCAHACRIIENDDGTMNSECYCHPGFELQADGGCLAIDETQTEPKVIQVDPTALGEGIQPVELQSTTKMPLLITTDAEGNPIPPVVSPIGRPLSIKDGEYVDPNGKPIQRNEAQRPVDPAGNELRKNEQGEAVYPYIDPKGEAHPTPPVFTMKMDGSLRLTE
ncbi:unnamed protein product, partial [Mesorhabditis spiculigera]